MIKDSLNVSQKSANFHSCLTYMLARSTKWREFQFFKQLMDYCRLDPRSRMEKNPDLESRTNIPDPHPCLKIKDLPK